MKGNIKALKQTWEYMDKCGTKEGHLVIFDRTEKPWEEKIFRKAGSFKCSELIVWGM
ncbi:Uncharacterized protein dnl_43950 [Desulfonema limicola]|uniref:Uncharacterized protein n=2 Tax=Desulfonema limicola TaxID=45656 RepID=A0A975GI07_9BACT|nr:Uncharacterized protein dnl_43950 [Desulfonema limicola]